MTDTKPPTSIDRILDDYQNLYCTNCGKKGFYVQYDDAKAQIATLMNTVLGQRPFVNRDLSAKSPRRLREAGAAKLWDEQRQRAASLLSLNQTKEITE